MCDKDVGNIDTGHRNDKCNASKRARRDRYRRDTSIGSVGEFKEECMDAVRGTAAWVTS